MSGELKPCPVCGTEVWERFVAEHNATVIEAAALRASYAELEELSRRYYLPDGTYEVMDTPGAVLERRKAAAVELARLEAEVSRLRESLAEAKGGDLEPL